MRGKWVVARRDVKVTVVERGARVLERRIGDSQAMQVQREAMKEIEGVSQSHVGLRERARRTATLRAVGWHSSQAMPVGQGLVKECR